MNLFLLAAAFGYTISEVQASLKRLVKQNSIKPTGKDRFWIPLR